MGHSRKAHPSYNNTFSLWANKLSLGRQEVKSGKWIQATHQHHLTASRSAAEAALRCWDVGNAGTLYERSIQKYILKVDHSSHPCDLK